MSLFCSRQRILTNIGSPRVWDVFHNVFVSTSPVGSHLNCFFFLCRSDVSSNKHMLTHTHAHNQTTFLSPAHEAPFKRGLQEDGVYAKQVRCANLTSALTHACVHADITCTHTSARALPLPTVSQMKAWQLSQQFSRETPLFAVTVCKFWNLLGNKNLVKNN